jgi:hypothetical protein
MAPAVLDRGLVLLDETDTRRRILQHALILDGLLLLLIAGALIKTTDNLMLPGGIVLTVGLVSLLLAFFIKQRWTVPYKGHVIRFENDALRGERLFIDDDLVAKGGLGVRMVLQGSIKQGAGTGDRITAVSEAGLLRFRCRITATPA